MAAQQVVVFSIDNEFCGVDAFQVEEILQFRQIDHSSTLPGFLEGTVQLRGKTIPVVDLNKRLGFNDIQSAKDPKIIICSVQEQSIGFIVNEVLSIDIFFDEDMEIPPVASGRNRYFKKIGKKEDRLVSILDFKYILSDEEMKLLLEKNFEIGIEKILDKD